MANTPDSEQTVVMNDGITDPRFKLLERLGSGGMGDVYLAEDSKLRRRVAIKTVRPDLCKNEEIRKRIERECLLHARVGAHPHIVTLFDRLETGDNINLVMEYVDGKNLSDMVKDYSARGLKMPERDALNVAIQCLDALSRIHAQGIVHRDIKPQNILVSHDDSGDTCAKLMDFGIARLQDPDEQATALTSAEGSGPGTPAYMAPEQIDPKTFGYVSPATDIYAVGIMLYQLLSGEPPFTGSLTEIFRGHLTSVPPALSPRATGSFPAPMAEILRRALAKDPKDRFPSAKAFREELVAVLSGSATPQSVTPDTARTMLAGAADASALQRGGTMLAGAAVRQPGGRKTGLVIAVVAVVLLAIAAMAVAAWFMVGPGKPAEPSTASQPPAPEIPAPAPSLSATPETRYPIPGTPTPAPPTAPPASAPLPVQAPAIAPPAPVVSREEPSAPQRDGNIRETFDELRKRAAAESTPPPAPQPTPKAETPPVPKQEPAPAPPPTPKPKPETSSEPKPAPTPPPPPATPSAQTPSETPPTKSWADDVTPGSSSSQKK